MGLNAKEKISATKVTAPRYQKATKKQKKTILEEFVALTGYDRCYASRLLRTHGKKVYINGNTVIPQTPYHRVLASPDISKETKK